MDLCNGAQGFRDAVLELEILWTSLIDMQAWEML